MDSKRQPIKINTEKNIYFASDQHFGAPDGKQSREREKFFVQWLDQIKPDCGVLFLLGDLFDFWFEYREVVPKGYIRVMGKLAEFSDAGIPIYFFIGNHDLWMKNYLKEELNAFIFKQPQAFELNGKSFLIGHGDGLDPGDKGYKRMKKLFTNPIAKALFYCLHPDWAVWLGKTTSRRNKYISGDDDVHFLGEEKEWLVQYCKRKLETQFYDFFVFGHRHLPLDISLGESRYINLGDWIQYFTYAKLEGTQLNLLKAKELYSIPK